MQKRSSESRKIALSGVFGSLAAVLMLMGGMSVDPQEAQAMDRVCLMFEDADPAQVQAARNEWRAVTAAGLATEPWVRSRTADAGRRRAQTAA